MAPVDVERVYAVFNVFAVEPRAAGSSGGGGAAQEPYIPECFLAVAAREVGFYPTTSAVHGFLKSVPSASAGEITFAAFLQFCEDVAHTNRLGRSAIYKMVDDIDTRGGGLISRRELFLILTNGSATISDGEIEAVMEMLDPTQCGYVELKDLAALLIEQCQHQRSLSRSSRSRSRPESQQRSAASPDPVAGRQNHQQHTNRPSDSRPQQPPQQQQQQQHRNARRPPPPAAGAAGRGTARPRPTVAQAEPEPQAPASSSTAIAPAVQSERDRSFKRTDIGSNGEAAYRKYGSLYNREDTFERTQTAMTVDVDGSPSVSATATQHRARATAMNTAVSATPLRGTAPQAAGASSPLPRAPASAPPLAPTPSASPAAAAATAAAAAAPLGEEGAPAGDAEANGNAAPPSTTQQKEGEGDTVEYSHIEAGTTVRGAGEEEEAVDSPAEAPEPAAAEPYLAPTNPPRAKETKTKCCAVI